MSSRTFPGQFRDTRYVLASPLNSGCGRFSFPAYLPAKCPASNSISSRRSRRGALMLGAVWVIELVYLQARFQYGRALVRTVAAGEVRAGDVPRRRLELEAADGTMVCEAGRPLSRAQANRLRRLGEPGLPEESSIERKQGFPFVPFITAGALLTAVFAGNLPPP